MEEMPEIPESLKRRSPNPPAQEVPLLERASGAGPAEPAEVIPSPTPKRQSPDEYPTLGCPSTVYSYTDINGGVLMDVCRWERDHPQNNTGKKQFRPRHNDGTSWVWKFPPGPRPLFGLREIAAERDKPVLLVEGERTAEAAQQLSPNHAVVTWAGGANAYDKTDWSPLHGRHVVIWPDADEAGRRSAQAIAEKLCGCAISVAIAETKDLPVGWDLADPPPFPLNVEQRIRDAVPFYKPEHDQSNRHRFGFIPQDDLECIAAGEPLVANLLEKGGLSLIIGPPKTFKSFVALDLCQHIARGECWRGLEVAEGAVAYVALEGGSDIPRRVRAFEAQHERRAGLPFFLCPTRIDFSDPGNADIRDFIEALRERAISMVILDTLDRAVHGRQTDEEIGNLIACCDRIRSETGAHVMLVHHTPRHDSKRPRGPISLDGAVDTILTIHRRGRRVTLNVSAQRSLPDEGTWTWEVQAVKESLVLIPCDNEPESRGDNRLSLKQQKFMRAVRAWCDNHQTDRVSEKALQQELELQEVVAGKNPKARFNELRDALQNNGEIDVVDGMITLRN